MEKIKYATDAPTFAKAVALYESGKVTQFEEGIGAYSAVVVGTKPYRVSVETRRYGYGHCECYLGRKDILCKHIVALAIAAVKGSEPLTAEEKRLVTQPVCSGKSGTLSQAELSAVRKSITAAMRYIKPYDGSSESGFRIKTHFRKDAIG
ncbi:MAG: SWIM zinc finger family protein [Nitrospirota bacterium]